MKKEKKLCINCKHFLIKSYSRLCGHESAKMLNLVDGSMEYMDAYAARTNMFDRMCHEDGRFYKESK